MEACLRRLMGQRLPSLSSWALPAVGARHQISACSPTALPGAAAQGCSLLLLISHHDSCYHVFKS